LLSEAGRCDEQIKATVEEALEAVGPEPSPQRAALLGALSQELYWVDAQGLATPLAEEAVEIAREIDDPRALANALQRLYFTPVDPDGAHRRLEIIDEMLAASERAGDRENVVRSHAYRVREFLELGDIAAVDREIAEYARLAEALRMPQHIWDIAGLRAMRATLDGDLAGAERLAEQARDAGARAEQPLAAQYYGIQLTQLRRHQGRAAELLPPVRELAERYPAIPAWRTALIGLEAMAGDLEVSRVELERFVGEDFSAIPRDFSWLPAMGLLGEATALLRDSKRAELMYELMLPYEELVIVIARAAASGGPVARILGLLAGAAGRSDDAERHLRAGVEISTRMGDRPWQATGRVELAEVLLERGRDSDREQALELLAEALSAAREMEARGIADRALKLRLEAQGLAGVDVTTSIDDVVSALESERPDMRAHAAPDGTVAILFSDIEDSTVLTERLGDKRWLEVLREHNSLFREHIARHGGYEVKSQGDGFMLAFPDPAQALQCAAGVQRSFAEREREGDGEALRVRMGLHTGEVIAEEGDFFGKNVILAARIAGQACGAEILVSESMREAAAGESDGMRFDAGRDLELKGLAGTHRVYRAEWSESGTGAAAPA
jgi:class 3 adenylate cyclase